MKGKFLAWLLLIILSSLALTNSSFKLEHDQGAADLSRSILQEHDTDNGLQGAVQLNGSEDDDGRGSRREQEMVVSEKGKKGKTGVYGGANVAHRPHRTERSSATPHVYLVTKTMLHVSFSLILLLFCKLV
ncbi:hypothetical protein M0R45_031376 [Rubus argutus]|uniref:Uncharacterized protein n=1 Tax=Rubus argutus TaxID=59490 RepID=A0AAW1WGA0_RUBAR